jgi:acyl carrier protein
MIIVFQKIKNIISQEAEISEDRISIDSTFESLELDSLDVVQIIIELEEEFEIKINNSEDFKNIQDIVNYIEKK